jgi:hypothetical protein
LFTEDDFEMLDKDICNKSETTNNEVEDPVMKEADENDNEEVDVAVEHVGAYSNVERDRELKSTMTQT